MQWLTFQLTLEVAAVDPALLVHREQPVSLLGLHRGNISFRADAAGAAALFGPRMVLCA